MPISINVRDMDQDVNDIKAGGFVDVPEGKGLVKIIEFNERAGSYGQDNMKLVLMAWSATRGKGMEHMEVSSTTSPTRRCSGTTREFFASRSPRA